MWPQVICNLIPISLLGGGGGSKKDVGRPKADSIHIYFYMHGHHGTLNYVVCAIRHILDSFGR